MMAIMAIAAIAPPITTTLLPDWLFGVGEGVIVGVGVGVAVVLVVGVAVGVAVADGLVVGRAVGAGVGVGVCPEPDARTKTFPGPFTVAVVDELPELAMFILAVFTDQLVKL